MGKEQKPLSHMKSPWRDEVARKLSGVDRLVYLSNLLGSDLTLTNAGGGDTSSKRMEKDPLHHCGLLARHREPGTEHPSLPPENDHG